MEKSQTFRIIASMMATAVAARSANLSDAAYILLNARVSQNQSQFFVYQDIDSPFNHGFPSGLFASSSTARGKLHYNPGCVYSVTAANGCSSDPAALDRTRGTVFQFTFDPLNPGEFVGLNFEEPENWGVNQNGAGYDLTGATQVVFDAISPGGGIQLQFSVNGAVAAYRSIPQQWTTITINLSSLGITSLSGVHKLFGIASNDANAAAGGTVLLDNIRFLPVPASQTSALGLPLANQVFGIQHVQNALAGSIPIPPDQIAANLATVYESALAIIALIQRGQSQDLTNARLIADTLVYALGHDNQGDPLPASGGSTALHSGMYSGDIALFNSQGPQPGQQGQVRLAGFTAAGLCPQTGFCLVLDGATGGNEAFGMLALLAAYRQFQSSVYLNAALTLGNWIYGSLLDSSGTGYGGYFVGYPDQGLPKTLQTGKSTENNADIFAAFTALASVESAAGNSSAATLWTSRANIAGDFVMQMYDSATGHFFAGTVPSGQGSGPGIYPNGAHKGNDVINTFDFLDTETFTTLAMAQAPRYQNQIDWRLPVQWLVNHFQSSVTAAGVTFQGFDLIQSSEHSQADGPAGIAWEFTGQAVATMKLVDTLYGTSQFATAAGTYLSQIQQARTAAPYTDAQGIVASTLQNGDTIPPYNQCLVTPYQCIAERVGLAATIWGIAAEQGLNLLTPVPVPTNPTVVSVSPINGGGSPQTFSATFASSGGAGDLSETDLLINASLDGASACWVYYLRGSNALRLINDGGTASVAGSISPGSAGSLSNSQCTVANAGAVTISGTNLTLPLNITFASGFSGTKTVFGDATSNEGLSSGWKTLGTWTPSGTPNVVSISPINGGGSPQTFNVTFSSSSGTADLAETDLLINATLNGTSACWVYYLPGSNVLRLINDAGTASVSGSISPGSAGSLSNSQCTVANAGAATASGNNLTLPLTITFASGFAGTQNVYGYASTREGGATGWKSLGTWTRNAPGVVSVSPINGSGSPQTFNATFSAPNGTADLSETDLLINSSLNGAGACWVYYLPGSNTLRLINDAGTAPNPGSIHPGSAGSLSNSQCTLSNAGAVGVSGNNLTLPLTIAFTSGFGGIKTVYGYASTNEGSASGWRSMGTWAGNSAPTVVSVSPINGSGSPQTFNGTFAAPNGASDIAETDLLINSSLNGAGACWVYYLPGSNTLRLINDAGSASVPGAINPGSSGAGLSNSQCTIGNAGPATISGNNLTLPLTITFAPGFGGTKNVYGYASVSEGSSSGWTSAGTWTGH